MEVLLCTAVMCLLGLVGAHAQTVEGDWRGSFKAGPVGLHVLLHVTRAENGELTATFDSPDQGARGIPVTSISLADSTLKFEIARAGASYEGVLNAEGSAVKGKWTQGSKSFPLEFVPTTTPEEAVERVPKPSDIDGEWRGALEIPGEALRLVIHIATFEDGMKVTMDSPDQNLFGIPTTSNERNGGSFGFEMKQLGARFSGTIDAGLSRIDGTLSQRGGEAPLLLERVQ
jgi:hypothetical protein